MSTRKIRAAVDDLLPALELMEPRLLLSGEYPTMAALPDQIMVARNPAEALASLDSLQNDPNPVVDEPVLRLACAIAETKAADALADASAIALARFREVSPQGDVMVNIRFWADQTEMRNTLTGLGFRVAIFRQSTYPATQGAALGWASYADLDSIARVPGVLEISLPIYSSTRAGSITTDGGEILGAYDLQTQGHLDGTGVTIGVISNGAENWRTVHNPPYGELPEITDLDEDGHAGDEGTAMMEVIHDLAPGAELYFAPAPMGALQMAGAIDDLVAAGCTIIVDDIGLYDEPMFEDGDVALAAMHAITYHNVTFISAAGNDALAHYQAQFYGNNTHYHRFNADPQVSHGDAYILPFQVDNCGNEGAAEIQGFLQWSDQWGYSANDYNLELYHWDVDHWAGLAAGSNTQDGEGHQPLENVFSYVSQGELYGWKVKKLDLDDYDREIELYTRISPEWLSNTGIPATVAFDSSVNNPYDSIFGHAAAEGVIAVGAIDALDSGNDTMEGFSSRGSATFAYDFEEDQEFEYRNPELIAGIDGVATRAGLLDTHWPVPHIPDIDGLFYGTSAAAAHIAGIAALWKQSDPASTPDDIMDMLTSTAVDLETYGEGYDNTSGYGRADALAPFTATSSASGAPDLTAGYDTGVSNSDNYTSLDNSAPEKRLVFNVAGTALNARVFLYAGGVEFGSAVAGGTSVNVTTNGSMQLAAGQHTITAKQAAPWELLSVASTGLTITIQDDMSATPGTPVLTTGSDTGIYDDDRITKLDSHDSSTRLTFTVSGTVSGATVRLYLGQTEIGYAVATGTTTDVTTNGTADLSDGEHTITAKQTEPVKFESPASSGLTITVDTTAPTVEAFARFYQEGDWDLYPTTLDTIVITFSADLYNAPVVGDLTLYNLSTSQAVSPDPGPDFSYDGQTNTATWDFDGLNLTTNAGWYLVTISGTTLTDIAGNAMGNNYTYGAAYPQDDMLIPLLGDATLNGTVDGFDFTALSLHWLESGKTWVDGDFVNQSGQVPGDGFVDGFDFSALSLNFLESLSR